jgi:hypothetical protein
LPHFSVSSADQGLPRVRPIEHGRDVAFVTRIDDDVGRRSIIAQQPAHIIRVGFAVGMCSAIVALD